MKVLTTVIKVVLALAAVAGAIYVIATYGDKIVAWAKKMLGCTDCAAIEEDPADIPVEEVEAPAPVEEATPAEEVASVEEPVAEDSTEVVAAEHDFEG